jgi:phosphoglycolate phosphatase-like HAD superfamily hydrolase
VIDPAEVSGFALVFDLDGVVLDVRASYRQAYVVGIAYYLREFIRLDAFPAWLTVAEVNALKRVPGHNAPEDTVRALLDRCLDRGAARDDALALALCHEAYVGSDRYTEVYGGRPLGTFPGLQAQDRPLLDPSRPPCRWPLGVYTGRRGGEARLVLEKWRFFSELRQGCAATPDTGAWKPDPAPLLRIVDNLRCPGVIYFGDTADDRALAQRFRAQFPEIPCRLVQIAAEDDVAPWPDADLTLPAPTPLLDRLGA